MTEVSGGGVSNLAERLRDASLDHNAWRWGWLGEAIDELNRLRAELERERMRLAACGTAALGYFYGCHEDYKSASLDDVLRLVEHCKRAEAERDALRREVELLREENRKMSDLIERLRKRQMMQDVRGTGDRFVKQVAVPDALCQQAADEMERLRERAERAEAERDALRKDAERLDWLRNHTIATGLSRWMGRHQFLDAAIDAAMKESSNANPDR